MNPIKGWQLTDYLFQSIPFEVISDEVTVPLGLCIFTCAIASFVGPLAVSNQYHLSI